MSQQEAGWKQKVDLFRKRFGAREDTFGVKHYYTQTDNSDPQNPQLVEVAQYHPQCMNYGDQRLCLIAQNKGGCTSCDHKKPQPLTDEWIWKHISGQKELILYLVQREGIKFGACDFDRGECFEDAKAVRDCSLKLGLPCYIARSTKKGYHLYWFFTQTVPAHHFTSLVDHIYQEVGFMSRFMSDPSNPPPEVFPKQVMFNPNGIGNGIKPPMIEPRFREGFNCWVDDNAVPIDADTQWDYFRACEEITAERLLEVLKTHDIHITEAPVGRRRVAAAVGSNGEVLPKEPIKPKGDFWKVIKSCPAMAHFWEKNADGTYKVPPDAKGDHAQRTASIAFAIATENGTQAIVDRWGEKVQGEIDYALATAQHPYTCKAMQNHGICRVGVHPLLGDHCMKRVPPGEIVNGQYRVNPDGLPESEWKDPSPIKFATGFMTFDQLMKSLNELFSFQGQKTADGKDVSPPQNFDVDLRNLVRSAHRLDPDEQKKIRDFIEVRKVVKKSDLKEIYKSVDKEEKERELERKKEEYPNFTFNKNVFFNRPTGYFVVKRDNKGNVDNVELTNFHVNILEELTLIKPHDLEDPTESQTVEHRWIKGSVYIASDNKNHLFKASSNDWIRSSESFFSFLTSVAGTSLLYDTSNYNAIRNCVFEFSKEKKVVRKKVEDFGYYRLKGGDAFVTPSVIVTRDQIKPNTELELQFTDETCKHLDFKIIDDSQFKDLALHILSDYFECSSSTATMTLFAHALGASIMSHLPHQNSPVVWVDGSFGEGKSFVANIVQNFYGNFSNLTASDSTGVGKLAMAHSFRNAFLVFDDFKKSLSEHNLKQVIQLIQKAYDRSGRVAAKRDGHLREESTSIRGLIAITGEEPPLEEASAISRMILVDIKKNSMNKERGEKAFARRGEYCGFTPYFIQYVYNLGREEVRKIFYEYHAYFEKGREGAIVDNMNRITKNMAFNMTPFRLAMDMLVERGVIPVQKRDELCARHLKNLDIARELVVSKTGSQRGSTLFLNCVRELLQDPARYHITHLPGFDPTDHKNSKPLGFWRSSDPEVIFLYHGTALGEVGGHLKKLSSWAQSQHQVARQLLEDGHLAAYDPSSPSHTKYVKTPNGGPRNYCWAIKMKSLGFEPPSGGSKAADKKEEIPLLDNVVNFAASE